MLYLIPTPIGNLEDMTFRAVRLLKEVDLILVEDTRTSGKLLKHFDIATPTRAYHMHNEHRTVTDLVAQIQKGMTMALITDAGTPAISDPGFLLVREVLKINLQVTALPGATAFVPALAMSGIACERFVFEGFLPVKKGRQKRLKALKNEIRTMVFYESPHKILKTLADFITIFGGIRQAVIVRELSKMHEETICGSLQEIFDELADRPKIKGEIVVIVQGVH